MLSPPSTPYGHCPCSGIYQARWVDVRNGTAVVTQVPQGYCPSCKSRIYRADMIALLEGWLRERQASSPG